MILADFAAPDNFPGMANGERERHPGVLVAITAAGGVRPLARALGLDPSTVAKWRRVPQAHVPEIARLYGIRAYELRPDVAANRRGRRRRLTAR